MKKFLLIIGVSLAACQAPQVTSISDADKAAITENEKAYIGTMISQDEAVLRGVVTEDAVIMPPNESARAGVDEIVKWATSGPGLKELTTAFDEIDGSGNVAYVRGTYSVVAAINDSTDFEGQGKFLEVWRKQDDGSWKLSRDIWNSNKALPMAEEEEEEMEE